MMWFAAALQHFIKNTVLPEIMEFLRSALSHIAISIII